MRVDDFAKFIIAREQARLEKEADVPWRNPDPIIRQYRFCNVRREDDAVTKWIANNLRKRYGDHKYFWFLMVVARLFNEPETLDEIAVQREFILPTYKSERTRKVLQERKLEGKRVFNPAYIVSTNGMSMDKIDYVIDVLLDPLWEQRKIVAGLLEANAGCLDSVHKVLVQQRGLGSFMAAQVVADLKYIPTYRAAEDWATWAASGPGSRRGLNRVIGNRADKPWTERQWREQLARLRDAVLPLLPEPLRDLHAQDIQNCLCEFDKYERARTGEGKPKQLYRESEA